MTRAKRVADERLARIGCPTARYVGGISVYLCECPGDCPAPADAETYASKLWRELGHGKPQ